MRSITESVLEFNIGNIFFFKVIIVTKTVKVCNC